MLTKNLEDELSKSADFDTGLIEDNSPPELHALLNKYIDEKELSKADVIRMVNIDRNYGYQILNGTRVPTKNILIKMSLFLKLDTAQINHLLKLAEKSPLYVRNIVDARVFYAVQHNMDYFDAIDFIWGDAVI